MIRAAKETDVPALLPLMRGYCDFYGVDPPAAGLEEMVRALLAEPDDKGILLVATVKDEEIVGFAACGWKWSSLRAARTVILEDLYVVEPARGQGHADELIAAVADIARSYGAPLVSWQTMPSNHRARAVYDRVGGDWETLIEYKLELQA